ncbi:acyl-CoA-binding protein [Spongiivirga citrea]|uniref:Acyl-CoA-binding protein n=1 Tax=Spongiivirga citrea TaxID=1481457 RepID=A0A6M0CKC4_9FLAO|nr:acyl-CoA-binding protein [Spongiivirga citrea]NER18395.1 acyl-CoA-binding protein [Spongiivirga citrea]
MNSDTLNTEFLNAVEALNNSEGPFPADFLLRAYAYYKRATQNQDRPGSKKPLVNAFKANAMLQIKDMSEDEAKQAYIELVGEYLKKK